MKAQYLISTVSNGRIITRVISARDPKAARKLVNTSAKIISIQRVKREVNIYK